MSTQRETEKLLDNVKKAYADLLAKQHKEVVDSIMVFLAEHHNTGIKKIDFENIRVYLLSLTLSPEDNVTCYLEELSETEITDEEDIHIAKGVSLNVSEGELSDLSENENYGALES